jgi:uncharacterized membrane protein SpoIIM required for sporulation
MKVSELIQSRQQNWRELEGLCMQLEASVKQRPDAATLSRFGALYRSACADLALADGYQLPPETTRYLHRLVGRAHNQLYRSRNFNLSTWSQQLLVDVPRRLFNDNALRLAFCVFWGMFVLSMFLAYATPDFAERVIGKESLTSLESDFSESVQGRTAGRQGSMAGFYIFNNAGIGLKCFAFGLVFGIGGLYVTTFNACYLGTMFGYMARSQHGDNFFHFVTAHGPFELTAIVLSAAAGMRLGFSLIDTKGLGRMASLRRAADEAMPTMWAAILMFLAAALIEGFLSPSHAPYWIKAVVAVISAGLLMFYFVGLGYPREDA